MSASIIEQEAGKVMDGGPRTKGGRRSKRTDSPSLPRERILHVAARLFRERGYKGTTVRDVADEVGILSGSLFHHFRSKEEMLLDIMREAAFTMCIRADEVINRAPSPEERLRQLIDLEFEWMVGDIKKDYFAVLTLEWREVPESAKAEFTRLRQRYLAVWQGVLIDMEKSGVLRIPADAAALVLHGALSGALTWFKPSGRYSASEFRDMLMRLIQN